jgi:hypothetical protein
MSHASRRLTSVLLRLGFGFGFLTCVIGAALLEPTPAKAQSNVVGPGCSCPSGSFQSDNQCFSSSTFQPVAAICSKVPQLNNTALTKYLTVRDVHLSDYGSGNTVQLDGEEYVPGLNIDQFIRDHPQLFPEAKGTALAPAGGGAHLGMYVRPEHEAPSDSISLSGGGAAINNDGYGVKDSAGVLAPGTQTPGFNDAVGGGGVEGSFDAARLFGLGGGQSLTLSGRFDYAHDSIDYNRTAQQVVLGAFTGSSDQNTYTFSGRFDYYSNATYLRGIGGGGFGNGDLKNDITGGKGDFDSGGYYVDLKLGHIFTLSAVRGRMWALDVSGHGGYTNQSDNGFTDSSGFTYGTEEVHFGDIGGRAKLFMLLQGNNLIWEPFVAGTVDGQLDFSHTLFIPNQPITVADNLRLSQGTTFGGVEGGLDVFCFGGMRGGISGFYQASSDTNIEGGRAHLEVPF